MKQIETLAKNISESKKKLNKLSFLSDREIFRFLSKEQKINGLLYDEVEINKIIILPNGYCKEG